MQGFQIAYAFSKIIKGEATSEIAMALLFIWKAALHALPETPGPEDLGLVTKMAKDTPALIEAWWGHYNHKIQSWAAAGHFEERAHSILLLVNPPMFCNTANPHTRVWFSQYPQSQSPLRAILMEM